MRRTALVAVVIAAIAAPAEARTGPDCPSPDGRAYERFGAIRTFTADSELYGCLTDVGRAYRLDTGTIHVRSDAARRAVAGFGDWVAYPARTAAGKRRLRAINLRTGERHAASLSEAATAVVVNLRGTLAWIAGTELRAKRLGAPQRLLASESTIDRGFLSLERDEGCAVTWLADGEQRSSTIDCAPR
jgi:hypothetical protein